MKQKQGRRHSATGALPILILIFSAILTSCNFQSVQAQKPTTQPAESRSSGCTMDLLQELKHTSNGIGITTLENLEINLRALQGYWEEMDTQNECEQTIRGYMLEFFDDALQKDFNAALVHLYEAISYLEQ